MQAEVGAIPTGQDQQAVADVSNLKWGDQWCCNVERLAKTKKKTTSGRETGVKMMVSFNITTHHEGKSHQCSSVKSVLAGFPLLSSMVWKTNTPGLVFISSYSNKWPDLNAWISSALCLRLTECAASVEERFVPLLSSVRFGLQSWKSLCNSSFFIFFLFFVPERTICAQKEISGVLIWWCTDSWLLRERSGWDLSYWIMPIKLSATLWQLRFSPEDEV